MEKKRKIILIACDSYRTLLGFRGKLMESLAVNNDVTVFTPFIQEDNVRNTLKNMGIGIYENDLDGSNVSILSDLAYIFRLYKVIKQVKPDVFFPYTFKPVIYGSLVANFCKVQSIVPMLTGLGYNFLNDGKKNKLISEITRFLLKLSLKGRKKIRLILQNNDDYNTLVGDGILSKKNPAFVVNGSGVDLSYYDYSEPEIKNQSFLMIARLITAKGIREYYEAAKLILNDYPDVTFKLIGPRDHNIDAIEEELYQQIITQQVIKYVGEVQDVRSYIKSASVVVLPSYYGEGVPRCLLEAMAMGRAIITCNSVGCKETVNLSEGQQTGFLVPVKNSVTLAEKMRHFIDYPEDTITFGKNGRAFAKEKFDVKKINSQMIEILEGRSIAVN
ncbi:MAG TPA: glycosyltransferase family 4 protein [Sphingobacteriaceae bacterium]